MTARRYEQVWNWAVATRNSVLASELRFIGASTFEELVREDSRTFEALLAAMTSGDGDRVLALVNRLGVTTSPIVY